MYKFWNKLVDFYVFFLVFLIISFVKFCNKIILENNKDIKLFFFLMCL